MVPPCPKSPADRLPGDVLIADAPAILQAIEADLTGIDLQMLRQHGDGICDVAVFLPRNAATQTVMFFWG